VRWVGFPSVCSTIIPSNRTATTGSMLHGTRDATRAVIDYFVRTVDQSFRELAPADNAEQ